MAEDSQRKQERYGDCARIRSDRSVIRRLKIARGTAVNRLGLHEPFPEQPDSRRIGHLAVETKS